MANDKLTLEPALLADALALGNSRGAYPARWWMPTETAMPANPAASIVAPAIGAGWKPILTFLVPRGFVFVVEYHWHYADGVVGFLQGSGALQWGLYVNVAGSGARAVEDMAAMTTFRGSPQFGPWPLRSCLRFSQGSELVYQVANISQPVTAGSFISAGLHGRLEAVSCGIGRGPGQCGG